MGTSTLLSGVTRLRWLAACTILVSTSIAAADEATTADPEAGKIRSVICIGCHGLNGEGKEAANGQPSFPRISGQIESYLVKSIKDYKNDTRNDPMMGAIAKGLSDVDIANLSVFYANQK